MSDAVRCLCSDAGLLRDGFLNSVEFFGWPDLAPRLGCVDVCATGRWRLSGCRWSLVPQRLWSIPFLDGKVRTARVDRFSSLSGFSPALNRLAARSILKVFMPRWGCDNRCFGCAAAGFQRGYSRER